MKRGKFELGDEMIYLNHAAIGPLPKQSLEMLTQAYTGFAKKGEAALDFEHELQVWEETRESVAKLINGDAAGVTLTTNTASGLHIVADGLHRLFRQGGNVVITELEFTTNSYVWQKLAERYKLDLRVVRYNNQTKRLEGWQDQITRTTRLVSLSHVQFSNGYRQPLDDLVEFAHDQGALVNLDSIQALGIVPFDVTETKVDFLAAGGYKWLLGPLGTGAFYVNPSIIDHLDSILVGWFSSSDFHEMTHHPFHPWDDARRFQQSISPMFGVLKTSIDLVTNWNVEQSFAHVTRLHDIIIEKLQPYKDFEVISNLERKHRSGILTVKHPDSENLVKQLHEKDQIVAFRDGNIRIAPHGYTTEEEIVRFVDTLVTLPQS